MPKSAIDKPQSGSYFSSGRLSVKGPDPSSYVTDRTCDVKPSYFVLQVSESEAALGSTVTFIFTIYSRSGWVSK